MIAMQIRKPAFLIEQLVRNDAVTVSTLKKTEHDLPSTWRHRLAVPRQVIQNRQYAYNGSLRRVRVTITAVGN